MYKQKHHIKHVLKNHYTSLKEIQPFVFRLKVNKNLKYLYIRTVQFVHVLYF